MADFRELTAVLEQAERALDTASGCLMLVAQDRKPIDLAECREEIDTALRIAREALEGPADA